LEVPEPYPEEELTRPLRPIHDERMRQARVSFNAAVVLGVLGTSVILGGVVASFFGSIAPAGVAAASGSILDVLGFLFMRFHREENLRLDELRRDIMAMDLVRQIRDDQKRDEAIYMLIKYLARRQI
jgi:hypothetical protein